jgi:hypothetical protein
MNIVAARLLLQLSRRETVAFGPDRLAWLCCLRGTLWVTQTGRPEDLLIEAGQQALLLETGTVVIEAVGGEAQCLLRDYRAGAAVLTVAAAGTAATAADAAVAGTPAAPAPLAGGQATSAALRGLPMGAVAWPLLTAARSSSLGYWPSSQ